MKKTKNMALLTLALVAISLASCSKKDRTCTCAGTTTVVTTVGSGAATTVSAPESYTDVLKNTTKGAATGHRDCMSRTKTSSSSSVNGGVTTKVDVTTDINCTIK